METRLDKFGGRLLIDIYFYLCNYEYMQRILDKYANLLVSSSRKAQLRHPETIKNYRKLFYVKEYYKQYQRKYRSEHPEYRMQLLELSKQKYIRKQLGEV